MLLFQKELQMKTVEFSTDTESSAEDWNEDSDRIQDDGYADFDNNSDDTGMDISEGDLSISTRRISGLKKGLCARRRIEQIREQNALDRELNDYIDFDYLS